METTYVLKTERAANSFIHKILDEIGNPYRKGNNPAKKDEEPTIEFLRSYAKIHKQTLDEKSHIRRIETKFIVDEY